MVETSSPNQTLSVTYGSDGTKIAFGRTEPGKTNWKKNDANVNWITVIIDTSAAGFTTVPIYTASLGGVWNHYILTGTSSIYKPTAKSFEIYLQFEVGSGHNNATELSPDYANANEQKWHVNWIGIESAKGTSTQPSSTTPTPKVSIFADNNFQGASQELGVGSYDFKDLSIGIGNDVLSSLKVPAGYRVTLYEHGGFQGKSKTYTSDASIIDEGFNDNTSSIRIEKI